MTEKKSSFSPKGMGILTGLLIILLSFAAYSHVSAQTEPAVQFIVKSNNTIMNDPLSIAILTFSDGTSVLDVDGASDLPTDTTVSTTSDTTDSSVQATTSDTTDSSVQATTSDSNLSRTTALDSSNRATSGEVGSTSGEVGSTTGEVGSSTGELHSPTGEVGS
jgi:hypothetical protein